jgi:hypothetical protein
MTLLFGLTRTVWVHNAIAEIYSFGLVFLVLLLLIALWKKTPPPDPLPASREGEKTSHSRIYWLALIGGFGVFHHRALIMAAPALVYAIWPELTAPLRRKMPRFSLIPHTSYLVTLVLLGLLGFLPYLYLPLRANAGAAWVYGEPGTWTGFWDQFLGREASRFIGPPRTWEALTANFSTINTVLITDLTLPGLVLGLLGLLLAVRNPVRRRTAITFLLSGSAAYLFHIALYTDILSALILPVLLSIAFGWLFLAEIVISFQSPVSSSWDWKRIAPYILVAVFIGFGAYLFGQNQPFIRELTSNPTGLETIALAKETPPDSTLMLDWGPRLFAVGFARDVLGELPDVTLVSHKADFRVIVDQRKLVTADFTFYNRPVSWWTDQLGTPVYLSAAAPHLVEIKTQPERAASPLTDPLAPVEQAVECTPEGINLKVAWGAAEKPDHDLSIFVHLLDVGGSMIAQADEAAPIYGWRPLTSWEAGEIVRDVYPLPRLQQGVQIAFGLYRQLDTGAFQNEYAYEIPVKCNP